MSGRIMRAAAVAVVMVVLAVGVAGFLAEAAWARQDRVMAVAGDPGDGSIGDPGDGLDGDPNDGSDGDVDGPRRNTGRAGGLGSGEGTSGVPGDPGDGDGWRSFPSIEVMAAHLLRFIAVGLRL